uniref:Uncharacterized protein n=1 Tax=Myoviridae sp. ctwVB15 TaxID=2825208 RepID=A0A8S5UNK9_9CAUD|nr:MAG TPA: hypothetical protein [Myoviridae sp. ctwVB15]
MSARELATLDLFDFWLSYVVKYVRTQNEIASYNRSLSNGVQSRGH